MAVPTLVNVVLAFWPRVVMAQMQTTIMRANITAYSTAVGPSSLVMNSDTARENFVNMEQTSLVQRLFSTRAFWHDPDGPAKHLAELVGLRCDVIDARGGTRPRGPLHSVAWLSASGKKRTHSFASHPYGWFAFVVDTRSLT